MWPRTGVSHLWGRGTGTASDFSRGLPDPWSHVLYDLQKIRIQVQHIPNQRMAVDQDEALICEQNEASAYDQGQGSVCDQYKGSVCILVSSPGAVIKFPGQGIVFCSQFKAHSPSW